MPSRGVELCLAPGLNFQSDDQKENRHTSRKTLLKLY